jgi:hypothetical protein
MSRIRRINVSQIEGNSSNDNNTNEIRPFGEIGIYTNEDGNNEKLELLMFDGTRTHLKSKVLGQGILYGSNADSGDGAGLDTIKLIPDAEIYRNGSDQYLVVDPTAPNHIHLRAGGTIDNSNAQLFLGGETTHVSIGSGFTPPVYIKANDYQWTFGTGGVLTLPENGDIENSTGVSQTAKRTTGTWTVTPGDNIYSFTVPLNGVYQLWVRGNIPNGIISYTATAAVTNGNVPVLGTQYAWNYIDAGSPILFSSIPAQFVGTEGSISTATLSVGTTANTFVFGINNSTVENITVNWGYTKIS